MRAARAAETCQIRPWAPAEDWRLALSQDFRRLSLCSNLFTILIPAQGCKHLCSNASQLLVRRTIIIRQPTQITMRLASFLLAMLASTDSIWAQPDISSATCNVCEPIIATCINVTDLKVNLQAREHLCIGRVVSSSVGSIIQQLHYSQPHGLRHNQSSCNLHSSSRCIRQLYYTRPHAGLSSGRYLFNPRKGQRHRLLRGSRFRHGRCYSCGAIPDKQFRQV